mmetsp:Transcript_76260/g.203943  ORF Transcript_76260/g.203943 Transcript_76260/m.203943 type:complete len:216 (-) Transcript_76260:1772-2419(-)
MSLKSRVLKIYLSLTASVTAATSDCAPETRSISSKATAGGSSPLFTASRNMSFKYLPKASAAHSRCTYGRLLRAATTPKNRMFTPAAWKMELNSGGETNGSSGSCNTLSTSLIAASKRTLASSRQERSQPSLVNSSNRARTGSFSNAGKSNAGRMSGNSAATCNHPLSFSTCVLTMPAGIFKTAATAADASVGSGIDPPFRDRTIARLPMYSTTQ